MNLNIQLRPFTKEKLKVIYELGFTDDQPEWAKWNAPYFNDYKKYCSFSDFKASGIADFLLSGDCRCIMINGNPVGMVSKDWIDRNTRWLEVGIIVYDKKYWSKGIGTLALQEWISYIFKNTRNLEHVGLTTWSGNKAMGKVALKLGMKLEARVRKVRFYKGYYYDSLKFGILREEWSY